jgi:hypothetical protein
MGSMETEQRVTGASLSNMRELVKAMTKCSKATTATQVDESELLTQAGAIFSNPAEELPFEEVEAGAVRVGAARGGHLIDQLKAREKQVAAEGFKAEKPWGLTPVLLAFLENMSKQGESGKVLPWAYTREVIAAVYEERLGYEGELMVGGVGNGMQFDEFVVFYFLHKHRIRRLAEVKLLEFLISLKYYSRHWLRAELFCQLMGVIRYVPLFDAPEVPLSLDYNTQHYFFAVYRKLAATRQIEEEGAAYLPLRQAKKLMRASLFFSDEVSRSRLAAKLDKDLRVLEGEEYCDFDFVLALILDEYLAAKRRICGVLSRCFSRRFEENQGYFSIDEMRELFSEQGQIFRAGDDLQCRYPIRSDLQVARLYLYAVTAGKNGYDMNLNHFIASAQRYGFDAPFPFLHLCPKTRTREDSREFLKEPAQQPEEAPEQSGKEAEGGWQQESKE